MGWVSPAGRQSWGLARSTRRQVPEAGEDAFDARASVRQRKSARATTSATARAFDAARFDAEKQSGYESTSDTIAIPGAARRGTRVSASVIRDAAAPFTARARRASRDFPEKIASRRLASRPSLELAFAFLVRSSPSDTTKRRIT